MNLTEIMNHDDSPMIQIPGIGQMKLSQAKLAVKAINEIQAQYIRENRWKELKSNLDHGILQVYINAIVEAQSKQH